MKLNIAVMLAYLMMIAASGQNPSDVISSQVNEQINAAKQNLTQKAVEHILAGNLTEEHFRKDLNATGEKLKQTAAEKIKQNVSLTPEELGERAKTELENQARQRVQQPGFDVLFALSALAVAAGIYRRGA